MKTLDRSLDVLQIATLLYAAHVFYCGGFREPMAFLALFLIPLPLLLIVGLTRLIRFQNAIPRSALILMGLVSILYILFSLYLYLLQIKPLINSWYHYLPNFSLIVPIILGIALLLVTIAITQLLRFHSEIPRSALISLSLVPILFILMAFSFQFDLFSSLIVPGVTIAITILGFTLLGIWTFIRKTGFKKELLPFISTIPMTVIFLPSMGPYYYGVVGIAGIIYSIIMIIGTIYFMTTKKHNIQL